MGEEAPAADPVPVLRAWLGQVRELTQAIAVAGLASPDAELPGELEELATRAQGAGLIQGAELLRALSGHLERASAASAPLDAARGASDALHRLIAWSRMVGRELDLAEVEARTLRGEADRRPTRTVELWPVGLELDGHRLVLWTLDARGHWTILQDELVEVHPSDPLHEPAISRLFQDVIRLDEVLGGGVELVDHPVEAGRRTVVRPAFDRRPRRIPRGAVAAAPDPGPWVRGGPGWVELQIEAVGDGIEATWEGTPVPLDPGPAGIGTLTKRLIREGRKTAALRVIGIRRDDRLVMIAAEDPLQGERVHPAVDPRAFPLSRRDVVEGLDGVARILAGAAALHEPHLREARIEELGQARTDDALDGVRLELASRALTGMPARSLGAKLPEVGSLDEALRGPADRPALAAWLLGASAPASLKEALARRAGPLSDTDPLAVALVAAARAATQGAEAGRALLLAHRPAWEERWASPDHPLPEVCDLLLIEATWAALSPGGALPLPARRIWAQTVGQIHGQRIEGKPVGREVADGLWLAAGAGWDRWVF